MNKHILRAIPAVLGGALLLFAVFSEDANSSATGYISHQPASVRAMEQLVAPQDPLVQETLNSILSSPGTTPFDDIVSWVAANIADSSDLSLHGVSDYWQTPSETLTLAAGDCEDYSILLCSLLRAYGVPPDRVFVAVGTTSNSDWHALVVENYYKGIWREVDVQGGIKIGFLDESADDSSSLDIDYCFNDGETLQRSPGLPDGVYEVQLGASYFPSEAGTGTNFVRRLKAGQKLTAKVNWLPDTYASPYNSLILYPWSFNVYDSGGRQVFTWTGTALEGSVSFTAASAGDYRMEILKRDDSPRCLRLNVNPSGWLKVPLPGEAVVNLPSYTASVLQQYNPAIANVVSPDPALVQAVLGLINQARFLTNPQAVDTGANSAAQVHAADMLKNGFLSHYGSDGLKPYMRYTLAGGTGYESECIARAPLDPPPGVSAEAYRAYLLTVLEQTWQSMLQNQVDQKTIFDSDYRHVNIGVACDADNLYLVLQFETDQVTFTDTPAIQDGILHLAGKISDPLYQVQIYYDPAPGPLSTGQLGYAYYPVPGRPVALIRRMYGLPYPEEGQKISWSTYADPYTVPLDAKPATEMAPFLQPPVEHAGTVKYIEADAWQVQGQAFSVTSDLSAVLGIYGPGVYTVVLWGLNPGQSAVAYSYSIFLK